MKSKQIILILLITTPLLFSYNFSDLDSSHSEEEFNEKGYGDFMKLVESTALTKMDKDDVELLLQNIIGDVETSNIEGVKDSLFDESFSEDEINKILGEMPKLEPIDEDILKNLGNVDFDWAVDEYIKTGKIPKGYEYFKEYFDEISRLVEMEKETEIMNKKAEIMNKKAEIMIKESKSLNDKINEIKNKFKVMGLDINSSNR